MAIASKPVGSIFPGSFQKLSQDIPITLAERVSLCHPGWSAVVQSQLTATSASQLQAILLSQLPKKLGLQGLALSPRLKYSDAVTAHCNLNSQAHFFVVSGSHYVSQAGLEFLGSRDPPTLAFQSGSAGFTCVSHQNSLLLEPVTGLLVAYTASTHPHYRQHAPLGDSRRRSHPGRQRDSFGQRGASQCGVYGTGCPKAPLVPSPQGEQQLEVLRRERAQLNLGRPSSVGKGRPQKEN
ncbi:hypothetical protein AAY473_000663 [Plecturocebus cupreus]